VTLLQNHRLKRSSQRALRTITKRGTHFCQRKIALLYARDSFLPLLFHASWIVTGVLCFWRYFRSKRNRSSHIGGPISGPDVLDQPDDVTRHLAVIQAWVSNDVARTAPIGTFLRKRYISERALQDATDTRDQRSIEVPRNFTQPREASLDEWLPAGASISRKTSISSNRHVEGAGDDVSELSHCSQGEEPPSPQLDSDPLQFNLTQKDQLNILSLQLLKQPSLRRVPYASIMEVKKWILLKKQNSSAALENKELLGELNGRDHVRSASPSIRLVLF
jgi:hypothetical protein